MYIDVYPNEYIALYHVYPAVNLKLTCKTLNALFLFLRSRMRVNAQPRPDPHPRFLPQRSDKFNAPRRSIKAPDYRVLAISALYNTLNVTHRCAPRPADNFLSTQNQYRLELYSFLNCYLYCIIYNHTF